MNHNTPLEIEINSKMLAKAINVVNHIDGEVAKSPVIHIKEKDREILEWLAHILWDIQYGLSVERRSVMVTKEKR